MTDKIVVKAGRTAWEHIKENGLSPGDISAVFGASGAAKWLSIYGLDRAVFSQWLNGISHKIFLLGTSVGAWKLAAAAQPDPARAFDRLKDAYISQTYRGRITPARITSESYKILNWFVPRETIPGILCNPFFKLGFLSVKCRGIMAMEKGVAQGLGILSAWAGNLISRRSQAAFFQRILFHVPGAGPLPVDTRGFSMDQVDLNAHNFHPALLSSGSIPLVMEGVRDIPGTRPGVYMDGGVLDYHPLFPMVKDQEGFILYPHFYPHIVPGWFDKDITGRRAAGDMADRMILIAPSPEFVARLPYSRIPDRQDFLRFQGNDRERYRTWNFAAGKSRELGTAFLETVSSNRIRDIVQPF